jgi:hypothetical protein
MFRVKETFPIPTPTDYPNDPAGARWAGAMRSWARLRLAVYGLSYFEHEGGAYPRDRAEKVWERYKEQALQLRREASQLPPVPKLPVGEFCRVPLSELVQWFEEAIDALDGEESEETTHSSLRGKKLTAVEVADRIRRIEECIVRLKAGGLSSVEISRALIHKETSIPTGFISGSPPFRTLVGSRPYLPLMPVVPFVESEVAARKGNTTSWDDVPPAMATAVRERALSLQRAGMLAPHAELQAVEEQVERGTGDCASLTRDKAD